MIVATLAFLFALGCGLLKGRIALRWTVALIVVLGPMRGGLLALGDTLGMSDPGLAVNGLVPALVAALAVGVAVKLRPSPDDLPRPLIVIWLVIAAVVALNLPAQEVGLKLYSIGVAQYLVYPTLVLAAWPLIEPDDPRLITRLFVAVAGLVAATVLLQASGIESFIQAANSQVDGLAAGRYAGITGSYLHTSAFLGTWTVLAIGEYLASDSRRGRIAVGALLILLLSAVNLTFSRSGVMITTIGAIALLLFAAKGRRLELGAVLAVAVAIALAAGTIGGISPDEAGSRTATGLSPTADVGNQERGDAITLGIERNRDASPAQSVFGEGLAASGNARQLVDGEIFAVESYYVKLLVEAGIIGFLAVGAAIIWAGVMFVRLVLSRLGSTAVSIGAAGLGLSLYNVIYPALETQLLALTWWMLLGICLAVLPGFRERYPASSVKLGASGSSERAVR